MNAPDRLAFIVSKRVGEIDDILSVELVSVTICFEESFVIHHFME